MFTAFTYTYNLANALSPKCLELTNFPWVILYMFQTRFTVIAQITTFMCMSFAKVLLQWQPALFMKLNSRSTVNIATVFVIAVLTSDVIMRIDLHVIQNCEDKLQVKVYEAEFNRELCIPEGYDNSNFTVCEIYDIAENVYPIGCKVCNPARPTVSILILLMIFFETWKFLLGFVRNFKHFTKSIRLRKAKAHAGPIKNSNDPNLSDKRSAEKVQAQQIPNSRIIIVKEYNHASAEKVKIKTESTPPTSLSDVSSEFKTFNNNQRMLDSLNIDTKKGSPSLLRELIRSHSLSEVNSKSEVFVINPENKITGNQENNQNRYLLF